MSNAEVFDRSHSEPEPPDALARQERAIVLRSLIRTLPDGHRRLLEMCMREPRPSYKEMSETLAIPLGSIGPTRQRCLALLRGMCVSAGIEPVSA